MFSYEGTAGQLYAIGAYEDDCHGTPTNVPFAFNSFSIPSIEEVKGEAAVTSKVWVNESSGESANEEAVMLDLIVAEGE